jgi:hypothetical protein
MQEETLYRVLPGRKGDTVGFFVEEAKRSRITSRWFATRTEAEDYQELRERSDESEQSVSVENFGGIQ